MRQQLALDLGRVHVEPAVDEHVLEPVGDVEVAVCVHYADVAGVQPAVGVDRLGRLVGIVEIADHHVVAAYHHLAGLAPWHLVAVSVDDQHLDVVDGAARAAGDDLGRVVVATHRGDSRGLGEAVAGDDRLEAERVAHGVDERHRHRRRPGHRQAQR